MAGSESKSLGRGLQDRALVVIEVVVGLVVVAAIMGKAYGPAPTVIFVLCGIAATYTGYNLFRMVTSLGDPTLEVQGRRRDEAREALEYEKKLLLQGIKELEVDYGVGKVDERDYANLRKTAEDRALNIISRLRQDDAHWQRRAEQLVSKRVPGLIEPADSAAELAKAGEASANTDGPKKRAQIDTPTGSAADAPTGALFDDRPAVWKAQGDRFVCTACNATNDPDGRYCQACGRPRAKEAA